MIYNPNSQISGIGAFRDHESALIEAFLSQIQSDQPLERELQAVLMAIDLGNNLNIDNLIIEEDSMIILDAHQQSGNLAWQQMAQWKKIKRALERINSWRAQFSR